MLSIRRRAYISRFIALVIFLSLVFPLSKNILERMINRTMKVSAKSMVESLLKQTDPEQMVQYLISLELNTFFYVTLIDDQMRVLYDARLNVKPHPSEQANIAKALRQGKAFEQGSPDQPWTFTAYRFYFQDKPYVLMASLSVNQLYVWSSQFRWTLFILLASFMTIYSLVLWWGGTKLIRPLLDIARVIKPYATGKTEILSPIPIQKGVDQEYKHLASTINLLLEKGKEQTRLHAEEKSEKETILDTVLEGVLTIDTSGIVRYVNPAASRMFSEARRHMTGKSFMPIDTHPKIDLFKRCQAILKLAGEQGNMVTDSISLGDEGQKLHLDLIAVPKPLRSGMILVLQDKSSQYKVVEMGKDFITNASHELRTPITIIKGFAETLQDIPSVSPPMLSEITEKIVRNCHRMDTLVKNLLTLADIEYIPETRFQPCDIVALADNCKHFLLNFSPSVRVDIEKSHDRIMVDADPDLLELALMNLLENGVKYSKAPAHLTIYLKERADESLIAIQDRGIGIPKEDQLHVFERFYTVNKAHSRRLGGAGLGLSIVKTIIEKHEGSISVASVLGQGATFTIRLPSQRNALLP